MKTKVKSTNKINSNSEMITEVARKQSSPYFEMVDGELKPVHRFISSYYDPVPVYVNINGEEAKHILEYFNGSNRTLRTAFVEGHARAMERGEWKSGNDCLMFTEDGTRINGEHRLTAVVLYAERMNPNNLAETSVPFLVLTGQPPEMADIVDGGASRSLVDTAVINGTIKKNDTVSAKALKLIYNSFIKTNSGEGFNKGLCTKKEAQEIMERDFPSEPSKTYGQVAREAVDIINHQDKTRPLFDGHHVALFKYMEYYPQQAKTLWQMLTSDADGLIDLQKEGVNIAMQGEDCPDENVVIGKFREVSRVRYSDKIKRKRGSKSHGGGAFSAFYREMLFVIQCYHNKTRVSRLRERCLVTEQEYKERGKAKTNFHWGLLK